MQPANAFGFSEESRLVYDINHESHKHVDFMEEVFLHEAIHIGFDRYFLQRYYDDSKPLETHALYSRARYLDREHISIYAWEVENREDNAESMAAWVLLRYFRHRLDDDVALKIVSNIPYRINLYDHFFLGEPLDPIFMFNEPYGKYYSGSRELELNRIDVGGRLYDFILELTDLNSLLFKLKSYSKSQ